MLTCAASYRPRASNVQVNEETEAAAEKLNQLFFSHQALHELLGVRAGSLAGEIHSYRANPLTAWTDSESNLVTPHLSGCTKGTTLCLISRHLALQITQDQSLQAHALHWKFNVSNLTAVFLYPTPAVAGSSRLTIKTVKVS